LLTLHVEIVLFRVSNVRVNNNSDTSATLFDLSVHFVKSSEAPQVKVEVLVKAFIVLVAPLDVHPKIVYWELMLSEKLISFNHDI
jgi:hypothetical protein